MSSASSGAPRASPLRRRLGDWKVAHGRRAVGEGVTETYRKAKHALRAVRERPSARRFHDWRKQVKALSYELRIVGGAIPELLTTLVPKVERLAELLGQVHDLDCAKGTAELHPRWFGRGEDLQAVLALLDERRAALEAEAMALSETVFAGRARDVRALVEIGCSCGAIAPPRWRPRTPPVRSRRPPLQPGEPTRPFGRPEVRPAPTSSLS